MPLPVRCFTCGYTLGFKWSRYFQLLQQGFSEKEAMDAVGIHPKRYCCRGLMLTTIDDSDKSCNMPVKSTEGFTFQSLQSAPKEPRIYDAV